MVTSVAIDEDYGYVILVGVASMLFSFALGGNVLLARKRYGIKYPIMFSDKHPKFNCLQRVHGNYLEQFPTFLVLLFCGGLMHPLYCACAGLVFLLGKIVYSIGYSTGVPERRLFGLFFYFGLLYLLYSTLEFAVRLLRWV